MRYRSLPAVYMLTHVPSGVFYVGSTKGLSRRMKCHRRSLIDQRHHAKELQKCFTGWEDIQVDFTYVETLEVARSLEQGLLNLMFGRPGCSNKSKSAYYNTVASEGDYKRDVSGMHSPESRKKMGMTRRGRSIPPETLRKQIEGRSKRVSLDGIEYPSAKAAAEALGLSQSAITWGLKYGGKKHANWRYVGQSF